VCWLEVQVTQADNMPPLLLGLSALRLAPELFNECSSILAQVVFLHQLGQLHV
jgi:hypothetical protein